MKIKRQVFIRLILGTVVELWWVQGIESHPRLPHPSRTVPPNPDNHPILACGERIRELIRYACPRLSSLGYYTPPSNQIGRAESIVGELSFDDNMEGRRLRRQIVQECCKQPCYPADLKKYCKALRHTRNRPRISSLEERSEFVTEEAELDISVSDLRKDKIASELHFLPVVFPYGVFGNLLLATLQTNAKISNGIWARPLRSLNSEEGQLEIIRHTRGHRGMEVITQPPQPEPVILHTNEFNIYS